MDVDLGELAPVRQCLAHYRRALKANPDDAAACKPKIDAGDIFACQQQNVFARADVAGGKR